ncbi:MAG TPA: hypothetical protein VG455_08850 [Acidimicrobiales bacterium]|nr:hypothetical protein [Acidimicrobiales bacterium]
MRRRRGLLVAGAAMLLAACGGGGGEAPEEGASGPPETSARSENPAGAFPDEPTFRDDLTVPVPGWPRLDEADGSAAGPVTGAYQLRAGSDHVLFPAAAPIAVEPGNRGTFSEVELTLTPGAEGGGGLFCRGSPDGTSMYAATFSGQGTYAVQRVEQGDVTVLKEEKVPGVTPDRGPVLLRLICGTGEDDREVSLLVTVNASPFSVVRDPRPLRAGPSSRVGVVASRGQGVEPATARFNNFALFLATPPRD